MRFPSTALATGLLAALALPAAATEGSVWVADFDKAVAQAKAENKDLFVDFTGSDWCGWCIRLHDEVFSHEEFLTAAQRDYILVALDYPNGDEAKALVPNPERNDELAKQYNIQGFPTILLMTAEGDVFGQTGYQPGGPEAYLPHLAELRTTGRAALAVVAKLIAEFDAAEGEARFTALDQVLAKYAELGPENAVSAKLVPAIKSAFVLDPEDAKGLQTRAVEALLGAGVADDEVTTAARKLDPKNAKGLLEQVVEAQCMSVDSLEAVQAAVDALLALDALGPIQDKQRAERMYVNAAFWCDNYLEDPVNAKKLAKKALALAPEDPELVAALEELLAGDDDGEDHGGGEEHGSGDNDGGEHGGGEHGGSEG